MGTMSIAYIISAYKQPDQLVRLVSRLSSTTSSFLIHVDKRSDNAMYRQMIDGVAGIPNVYFLNRHACYWGDFGHVRASLKGIHAICQCNIDCDYVVLLTGQDYPIKSNRQIEDFFSHAGQQFIVHYPLPCEQWQDGGLRRTSSWHVRVKDRRVVLPKQIRLRIPGYGGAKSNQIVSLQIGQSAPKGYRLFGGSSYWCLSRNCIEYIERFTRDHPNFVRFFRYVDVSDEMFFQTIVMNSPFSEQAVNDDLRHIDWNNTSTASPNILEKDDFRKIVESPKLFARKFDTNVDSDILDLIDIANLADQRGSELPERYEHEKCKSAP